MLNRKISIAIILIGFSLTIFAQKPTWTDYYKRVEMYPESEFLVGYISAVVGDDEDSGKLKTIYESIAKDKVIQCIQVEIESNNSLNISNVNGKSGEEFLSKSVSFSKANVAGLSSKSYYDRKKNEIFAIATVKKKELTFFYRNIIKSGQEDITQKLKEGKQFAAKGKKENALKSFYETMPTFLKIDEARTLLIALNRKMYSDINMDEINKLKLEIDSELNSLLAPSNLDLSEAAYFAAYGLYLQLGEIEGKLYIDKFSYENTGLTSEFSRRWNQAFSSSLVEIGKYDVVIGEGNSYQVVAYGNYWLEGGFIKIAASAIRNNELIAVSKGSLPISWLTNEKVDYIPEQIVLINLLTDYKLSIIEKPSTVKLGMASLYPIQIEVSNIYLKSSVVSIPIALVNTENGDLLCSNSTNEYGVSNCYLPEIFTENAVFKVSAEINLAEYLHIDKNSIYYAIAHKQNPVLPVNIDFIVEKPAIFLISNEEITGRPMDINTLEPVIKELLVEQDFNFVDDKADADYIILIDANITTSNHHQGIYFAYLDANLSIVSTSNSKEIFKTHIDQVKGGGSNHAKAAKKAYLSGSEKLKQNIQNSILFQ